MSIIANTLAVMEQMSPEDQNRVLTFAQQHLQEQVSVNQAIDAETRRDLDLILANYDPSKVIPGHIVHARMYAKI